MVAERLCTEATVADVEKYTGKSLRIDVFHACGNA